MCVFCGSEFVTGSKVQSGSLRVHLGRSSHVNMYICGCKCEVGEKGLSQAGQHGMTQKHQCVSCFIPTAILSNGT